MLRNLGSSLRRRMPSALARVLSAPAFPGDEDKTIAALLTHYVILFSLGFNVLLLPVLLLSGGSPLKNIVLIATITALALTHHALLRQGHVYGTTAVFLAMAWVVTATVNFVEGGLHHPGFMMHMVLILLVGFIFGSRWAFVAAGCSSIVAIALAALEAKGVLIVPPVRHVDFGTLLRVCLIMFAVAIVLSIVVGRMREFAAAGKRELLARREAELELERHRADLENIVRQRTEMLAQKVRELRHEKDFIALLMETSPVGIVVVDAGGGFTFVNAAAETILRRPRAEILRLGIASAEWGFADYQGLPLPVEELPFLKAKVSGIPIRNAPLAVRAPDGEEVQLLVNVSPLGGDRERIELCVSTIVDVTEQQRLENEMLRVQKLESLGVLAGGIAHDFNNLLTAIMGNISLAQLVVPAESPAAESLGEAEKASFQARDLTRQLLTFARGGAPLKQPVAIAVVVTDAVKFALRGSKVRSASRLPPGLWAVKADQGQLAQVFQNLVINAYQAMPAGGTLEVGAANIVLENGGGIPLPHGNYVRVTVTDHGVGIPRAHMERIFDPFFTTKKGGTGIGLAVVHSIVKNHGGHIYAESVEGAGSTFIMHLPASARLPVTPVILRAMHAGRGRVLVMDDEPSIRSLVTRMLTAMGYEVQTAADGLEAITAYREAGARGAAYDVVILDLTVPGGMGGAEAIGRLREIDPGVRAVVASGYSNDQVMSHYQDYGFCHALAKPYNTSLLSRVLNEVCALPDHRSALLSGQRPKLSALE